MPVSGVASNVLVSQAPVAAAAIQAALTGVGRTFGRIVSEFTDMVGPTDLLYDKTTGLVHSGQDDGYRLPGQPLLYDEPGEYDSLRLQWGEWGRVATYDRLSTQYARMSDTEFEAMATRVAATKTGEALEKAVHVALGTVTGGTNPWTIASYSAPAPWSTVSTDIKLHFETALVAFQAANPTISPNKLLINKRVRWMLGRNEKMVSQAGGRTGLFLNDDELLGVFSEYGIDEIIVADQKYHSGAFATAFFRDGDDATVSPAGVVWGHPGGLVGLGEDMSAEAIERFAIVTMEKRHRLFEFQAAAPGAIGVIPQHGFRIDSLYS
jgi:hypothetical protein